MEMDCNLKKMGNFFFSFPHVILKKSFKKYNVAVCSSSEKSPNIFKPVLWGKVSLSKYLSSFDPRDSKIFATVPL